MDVNIVFQAISSLGFPIVMCIVMVWYLKYTGDKHRSETSKLNAQHDGEIKELTTVINNNTVVLTRLCDKLDARQITL